MCSRNHVAVNRADHDKVRKEKVDMTRKSEKGVLRHELTFERVPFSSTKRGALFFSGGGSDSLLHRQQKRLWKRPLLRGFFEGGTWEAPGTEQERRNI